jgi:hypothetical protein
VADAWTEGPAIAVPTPLGEAEASIATIATSTQEEMARVATFGKRCAVLPLTNCVKEPLFMLYKFAGSNHVSTYVFSTLAQLS